MTIRADGTRSHGARGYGEDIPLSAEVSLPASVVFVITPALCIDKLLEDLKEALGNGELSKIEGQSVSLNCMLTTKYYTAKLRLIFISAGNGNDVAELSDAALWGNAEGILLCNIAGQATSFNRTSKWWSQHQQQCKPAVKLCMALSPPAGVVAVAAAADRGAMQSWCLDEGFEYIAPSGTIEDAEEEADGLCGFPRVVSALEANIWRSMRRGGTPAVVARQHPAADAILLDKSSGGSGSAGTTLKRATRRDAGATVAAALAADAKTAGRADAAAEGKALAQLLGGLAPTADGTEGDDDVAMANDFDGMAALFAQARQLRQEAQRQRASGRKDNETDAKARREKAAAMVTQLMQAMNMGEEEP